MKIEVGQKVVVFGVSGRKKGQIIDTRITKVGRKYFYVEALRDVRFFIDGCVQFTSYQIEYKIYPNRQAVEDEAEQKRLFSELAKVFDYRYRDNVSLDQLRRIKKIISENNE